jgi:mono/diheme cytochrome c family protein
VNRRRIAACCILAFVNAVWNWPLGAQNMPAGKGRDVLQKVCTVCHGLESIARSHNTRQEWIDLVRSMKDMGAEATDAETAQIVEYLSVHFGKTDASVKRGNPPAARRLPWEKDRLTEGQALYRENCVVCHAVDQDARHKLGPSFHHLFQRVKMPLSGAKPSRSYIAARIRVGGPVMPSFAKRLNEAEIDTLIDYIASK